MKRLVILTLSLFFLSAAIDISAATKSWEPVKTEIGELKSIAKDPDIEIKAGNGHLFVTANRQVQIKIFSILGQLISSETLSPGTHRLAGTPHGVYIIKACDLTCKVIL